MKVENCDLRFIKLTEMRERNWQEEFAVLDKPKKKIEKSKPLKSFKASSGIKEAIKGSRKKYCYYLLISIEIFFSAARMKSKISSKSNNDELKVDNLDTKTFNGGFFSVTSPIKVSDEKLNNLTRTPMKCNSLLKAVVSSEAKKKIRCV